MQSRKNKRISEFLSWLIAFALVFTLLIIPLNTSRTQASTNIASYIVQGTSTDVIVELVEEYGGTVTSRLELIDSVGAMIPVDAISSLLNEPAVIAITPNGTMSVEGTNKQSPSSKQKNNKTPETNYPDVVGADAVWAAGVTGKGVTVAVMDSGVQPLQGLLKPANGRGMRILAIEDFIDGKGRRVDFNGHGTHVAGVIANSEVGKDDEWNGIAPDVNLVIARVANQEGYASYEDIIEGITWLVENREKYDIRVMNFSMSAPAKSPYWADPVNRALMVAWHSGIVVVSPAGNVGPQALSIGVPGNNPYLITVGSFTDAYTPEDWSDDYIPSFSSAGPTHDGFVKPDLVAPGGHIVSLMDKKSYLAKEHPENIVAKNYFSMAGSSQATAVVSGITALMLSHNPDLTPDQVKYRLQASAIPQFNPETHEAGYSVWQQGSGRRSQPRPGPLRKVPPGAARRSRAFLP